MKIFVAGPLSAVNGFVRTDNINRAMDVGFELMLKGHQPFIPHLSQFFDDYLEDGGVTVSYERWLSWTCAWLPSCDALYFIDSSPGANRERALAEQLGLPIYESLEEVP